MLAPQPRWRSCSCRGASSKSCTSTSFWCVACWAARRSRLFARSQELCELSELDTARALLRQSAVLSALKLSEPDRYLRLEHLLVEARVAWPDAAARDLRRHALAASLVAEVSVVPAGRLLALLGQALKWQRHTGQLMPGGSFELLRGSVEARRIEPEACVAGASRASHVLHRVLTPRMRTVEAKSIRFGKKSHAQSACFSPDGQARTGPRPARSFLTRACHSS